MPQPCRLVLLTGVSGTGKTTIGEMLATELGWEFHEGDSYHSKANVEKMRSGTPLTDADRAPWLASIRGAMERCLRDRRGAVFACSALKETYRRTLVDGLEGIGLVFLQGDFETIRGRMEARQGHYMKADMLRSQFDAVEPPAGALQIDVTVAPSDAVALIRRQFGI